MSKILFKILLLFFLVTKTNAQDVLPFVENITKADYNGDNQVWSVAQANNAMYFASNHFFKVQWIES